VGEDQHQYNERIQRKEFGQFFISTWCADYPDPENFFYFLFDSQSPLNIFGYSNPAYDSLMDEAGAEQDWTNRMNLYHSADLLLQEDVPAIFLSYTGPKYIVVKPYLKGYQPSFIGVPQHAAMWKDS
jgi:ABC-type oligopeptide transport system substrate-binding subunit